MFGPLMPERRKKSAPKGYVFAKDGLLARDQGAWARDKLSFLEKYATPALGATTKKRGETWYLDLFAGPGRNVSTDGEEFAGSPIQMLGAVFHGKDGNDQRFGSFVFCNIEERDHAALQMRVDREVARLGRLPTRVNMVLGDSNKELPKILANIPTYAYLLVFADIEGPSNLQFETLRILRRAHESVDLYVLWPGQWLTRTIPYKRNAFAKSMEPMLNAYFGTKEWQEIRDRRLTSAQQEQAQREWRDLYLRQLGTLWSKVEVIKTVVRIRHELYDMIFASNHEAAWRIAGSASARSDQLQLLEDGGTP